MKHSAYKIWAVIFLNAAMATFTEIANASEPVDSLIETAWSCNPKLVEEGILFSINNAVHEYRNAGYSDDRTKLKFLFSVKHINPNEQGSTTSGRSMYALELKCAESDYEKLYLRDQNLSFNFIEAFLNKYVTIEWTVSGMFKNSVYKGTVSEFRPSLKENFKNITYKMSFNPEYYSRLKTIEELQLQQKELAEKAAAAKLAEADAAKRGAGQAFPDGINCDSQLINKESFDILGNQLGSPCSLSQDLSEHGAWEYRDSYTSVGGYVPSRGNLFGYMNIVNLDNRKRELHDNDSYSGVFSRNDYEAHKQYQVSILLDKYAKNEDAMLVYQFDYSFCAVDITNSLHGDNSFKSSLISKYGKPTYELTIPQLMKNAAVGRKAYFSDYNVEKLAGNTAVLAWVHKNETVLISETYGVYDNCKGLPKFQMSLWDDSLTDNFKKKANLNKKQYLEEHANKAATPSF